MNVILVTHLICAAAFAIFALMMVAGRERSPATNILAGAACATAIWAAAAAFPAFIPASVVAVIESARNVVWLLLLRALLAPPQGPVSTAARAVTRLGITVAALAVAVDLSMLVLTPTEATPSQPQVLLRIATAVIGLSLVENYYRNASEDLRWSSVPLSIAIAAIFAFDLFFYVDVHLSGRFDPPLVAARALADVMSVPLLLVARVRSKQWRTDLRLSHSAAFHAAALVSSGVFLVCVAIVGLLFRRYGGDWGVILQVTSLFGSVVVLATAMTSETARSRLRIAVLRNFFSYRYDYRVEWLRTIEGLSSDQAAGNLPERLIRVIADTVNCPGGVLFQLHDRAYVPVAFWNAEVPAEAREPVDSGFIAAFRGGRWIQDLAAMDAGEVRPHWLDPSENFWIAVPLPRQGELVGFVLLQQPRAPVHPDWEVFDLLRAVARQAASYLFEQQAERALADAQLLQEYSKRFAFVIHDIKNLSSQLGLILSNARRHGSNPEFQADVLHTVENSVGRMTKLLSQLKMASVTVPEFEQPSPEFAQPAMTDALELMQEIAARHVFADRIGLVCQATSAPVRMDAEPLRSVLSHLIDNALEASGARGRVTVSLGDDGGHVTIDVTDEGPGMEMSFVRDELFRPFRSTKDSGLGIGAFQTRELIRAAGGQLDVITKPGAGTTMRIVLGAAAASSRVSPAA